MADDHKKAIQDARKLATKQLAKATHYADFNARLMKRRADNPKDPLDAIVAEEHAEEAKATKARAKKVAEGVGSDLKTAMASVEPEFRQEILGQVDEWKRLRAIHQDMLDDPDAYGGVMLDGTTEIKPEEQLAYIMQYDAAIKEAQESMK